MEFISGKFSHKGTIFQVLLDKGNSKNKELFGLASSEIKSIRAVLESYLETNPGFSESLKPLDAAPDAPPIIGEMCAASKLTGVGPMAGVAGAVSERICRKLIAAGAKSAIVNNGGDIYAIANKEFSIGLYAGKAKVGSKLSLIVKPGETPLAICSSSSKMGHSLSLGECDLATAFSRRGALADCAATALANKVGEESDIEKALAWAKGVKGLRGALIAKASGLGSVGKIPELGSPGTEEGIESLVLAHNDSGYVPNP